MKKSIYSKWIPVGEHMSQTSLSIKRNEAFIFRNICLRTRYCLFEPFKTTVCLVQRVSILASFINSTDNVEGKIFSCFVFAASLCPRSGLLGTSWKKSTPNSALQPACLQSEPLVRMESLQSSMWHNWKTEKDENKNSAWVLWGIMSVHLNTGPLV